MKMVNWDTYVKAIDQQKHFCKTTDGDWATCFCGDEGSGKSTQAIHTAKMLDPDFDVEEQIANNLHDYLKLTRKFINKPFKAILYDEAVRMAFSKDHAKKINILLTKLIISNRSFNQFHLFTIPNVFYLSNYIREFRLRNLIYTYIHPDHWDQRYFGYYSRKAYQSMIVSPKARKHTIYRESLFKKHPPNWVCRFQPLAKEDSKIYKKIKEKNQVELLDEVEDEIKKMEQKGQAGFTRHTKPGDYLKFLYSNYGEKIGKSHFLSFINSEVGLAYETRKETICKLTGKLLDNDYMVKIGNAEYQLTSKGEILAELR